MRSFLSLSVAVIALVMGLCLSADADEAVVVMTNGDRFVSTQVWEDAGKIRFNMQGLVVTVNKEEVAAIIPTGRGQTRPTPSPQTPGAPSTTGTGKRDGGRDTAHGSEPMVQQTPPAPDSTDRVRGRMAANRAQQPPAERPIEAIGLDGMTWRMAHEQIAGLEKVATDPAFGGIDQYWRPDQPLAFGNALLDGLTYGFWQNQLYAIVMWAEGRIGYERLRKEVTTRFGQGRRTEGDTQNHVWVGDSTQRMLEFDPELNMAIFIMRSTELHQQIRQHHPN
ncbi:MAG: hypothetical protein KFF50_04010 [Desulfatitalea sp.]|nr:hypothetical protein [Desulfatitalea sp.]